MTPTNLERCGGVLDNVVLITKSSRSLTELADFFVEAVEKVPKQILG